MCCRPPRSAHVQLERFGLFPGAGKARPTDAGRLKVDYTTVSRRIAELEKDLTITLFERKTDGFVLTEEGHRLFAIAEKMEHLGYSVCEAARATAVAPAGRVRLATMEGGAARHLIERF